MVLGITFLLARTSDSKEIKNWIVTNFVPIIGPAIPALKIVENVLIITNLMDMDVFGAMDPRLKGNPDVFVLMAPATEVTPK